VLLPKRLRAVRFVLVLVIVILPSLAVALAAVLAVQDIVGPEAERRAELAGRTVVKEVEQAVRLGIPLPDLVGMDSFFDDVFRETAEVSWMAVTDARRTVLHARASRSATAPRVGATLTAPAAGEAVLTLPLRGTAMASSGQIGAVQVGWRVAAAAGPRQAVLSTLLLVLVGAIALAAEWGHWIWGQTVGAGLRALEDALDHIRRGDISVAPRLSGDDAVGRAGRGLSRLLRLVTYRLEDSRALAEDVAAAAPAAVRDAVLGQGRRTAEGWTTAPDAARLLPPRRQRSLFRFVLFIVVSALCLHLPGLLLAGGWHDRPAVLIGLAAGLAVALLMMRLPLPPLPLSVSRRLPARLVAVGGAGLAGMVVLDGLVTWSALPTLAGPLLGLGLGLLIQPVRSAARAEGSTLGDLAADAAGATVSGALVGLALGGLAEMFFLGGLLDPASAVLFAGAAVVVLTGLAATAQEAHVARWPNVQEAAAVLLRWPLLILALGPGGALRLLIAVVLVGALSRAAVRGMASDTVMLTGLGTMLAVAWWAGQAAARLVAARGRHVAEVLWGVMVAIGLVALVTPYDTARTALWGIGIVTVLAGAVAPLRLAAGAQGARLAGRGLGGDRVERTLALVEVVALALAPLLASLASGAGVDGLVRALAVVVLAFSVLAYPVLGPGGGVLRAAREARS
jgi:hypothetical protein